MFSARLARYFLETVAAEESCGSPEKADDRPIDLLEEPEEENDKDKKHYGDRNGCEYRQQRADKRNEVFEQREDPV
jgi:hypothetical protein